jgi:hypothetical protein
MCDGQEARNQHWSQQAEYEGRQQGSADHQGPEAGRIARRTRPQGQGVTTAELPRLHRAAIEAAEQGEKVLYVLGRMGEATEEFRQLVREVKEHPSLARVHHANGNQRIVFSGGGVIYFTVVSRNGGRGFSPDLLILCAPIGHAMIPAKRVLYG